ncbi:sulfite exporter TauE/SafE family protein [Lactococcus insecticola]|uniref:Membrane protein n=1 Tax=Pseudolactococcus insecticola TaxID=2709158 RepID=A0A6A0B815_9LACT|nr:sulfite exporter TauE/SafE family protein [Lactococcus insecticola]GFH40608.1 membrane protein [Lactococcus insecticola]
MTETLILQLIKLLLFAAIAILVIVIFTHTRRKKINIIGTPKKFFTAFVIGFFTDMLDTWGIGSYATTTTFFKLTNFIDDGDDTKLPGTMNIGHAIAVLVEALFFITAVRVEMTTLIPMTSAAVIGALTGTRLTKNWSAKLVQRVLGLLLIIAAIIMALRIAFNIGADTATSVHGLHGILLFIGVIFNFILGVLMTMGLGNYAPELVFFSLAGVNPLIALPVMMLDAAMIMFSAAQGFIKKDRVYWNGLLGMMIGGILGVVVAAKVITNIDINLLKKAMVVIVIYTGIMLIRTSFIKASTK